MANAVDVTSLAQGFGQMPGRNKLGFMLGAALLVALVVGSWLWGTTPEYKVLYSNIADRDGVSPLAHAVARADAARARARRAWQSDAPRPAPTPTRRGYAAGATGDDAT